MTVADSDIQGGLDCRCLASNLHDHTFRILSITTISTPHRGSSFADHFLETVGPERFPSFLSLLDMLPNGGGDGSAFESLTLAAMREFNEQTPDVPWVKYFSWGAEYSPGLFDTFKWVHVISVPFSTFFSCPVSFAYDPYTLSVVRRWPHSIILEKEGPNDGLVSVESAKWASWLSDGSSLCVRRAHARPLLYRERI